MPQHSLGFLAPTWLLLAMRGCATHHLNSRQHPLPQPSAHMPPQGLGDWRRACTQVCLASQQALEQGEGRSGQNHKQGGCATQAVRTGAGGPASGHGNKRPVMS